MMKPDFEDPNHDSITVPHTMTRATISFTGVSYTMMNQNARLMVLGMDYSQTITKKSLELELINMFIETSTTIAYQTNQ
jgi:hypothetical protein